MAGARLAHRELFGRAWDHLLIALSAGVLALGCNGMSAGGKTAPEICWSGDLVFDEVTADVSTEVIAVRCVSATPASDAQIDLCSVGTNRFVAHVRQAIPLGFAADYPGVSASWSQHFLNFCDGSTGCEQGAATHVHVLTRGRVGDGNMQASDGPLDYVRDAVNVTPISCAIRLRG